MGSAVRVRVEAKKLPFNASYQEKEKEAEQLRKRFGRACYENNILHSIKKYASFIRPCDKRRMKKHKKLLAIKKSLAPKPKDEPTIQDI